MIMDSFKMIILLTLHIGTMLVADPTLSPSTLSDSVGNAADASSNVVWANIPEGSSYKAGDLTYDSQGMEALYNMMRGFVNTAVFPQGFPYDTLNLALDGGLISDVTSNYTKYLSKFGGYGACVVIGFLFIFLFTLCGMCFCCCRCCGNCGGKMEQPGKEARAACKRQTFSVVLLVLTIFTMSGMICVYISNDQFTKALYNLDDAVSDNLDDITTYLDNTVMQVKHIGNTNFNFTTQVIYRDLDNIGYLVGIPLRTTLKSEAGVDAALNSVTDLKTTIDNIATALYTVNESIANVSSAADLLQSALNQLSNNVTATNAACTNPADCPNTGKPNMATYSLEFDKSALPDISSEVNQIQSVQNQSLTDLVNQARQEFENIPWKVQNETNSTVNTLKSTIATFSDKITPLISQIENIQNGTSTSTLNDIKSQVKSYVDLASTYNQYRWYGGIGLTSVILIIVLLQLLGLVFGVCGHRQSVHPTERGCLSNSGGNMLMASVGFIFIFAWLLMLLTTLTFAIGSPMERFICQPLTASDLSELETIIDTYVYRAITGSTSSNGSLIGHFLGSSVTVSFVGLLKDCQTGKSIYTALQLSSMFNISQFTNYKSSLDIDTQLNSIDGSIDLSNFEILTPDLQTQLNDLKTAVNINFTAFYAELNKNAMTNDLSTFSAALRAYATTVSNPNYRAEYEYHANSSDNIKSNQVADVDSAMASLEAAVRSLESAVNGTSSTVDTVIQNLNTTQEYLRNNASTAIKSEASTYANRLFGVVDSYVNDTLSALDSELGKCTPVWNLYNSIIVTSLCRYTIDTLNGFWFALGWCIFFFVPSLIFSVKLAKHFRRMTHTGDFGKVSPEKIPLPDVISHHTEIPMTPLPMTVSPVGSNNDGDDNISDHYLRKVKEETLSRQNSSGPIPSPSSEEIKLDIQTWERRKHLLIQTTGRQ